MAHRQFLGFFLFEKYGLNAAERGIYLTPAVVASLAGGFVAGAMIDRFSEIRPSRVTFVFAAFLSLAAVGMTITAFAPPLAFIVVASCVFGFGIALVGPAFYAVVSQVVPANVRTQALQMAGLAFLPSLFFFTPISLALQDEYGYRAVFLFSAPSFLIAAGIALSAGPFFAVDRANALAQALAADDWRRAKASGRRALVCRDVDSSSGAVQVVFAST